MVLLPICLTKNFFIMIRRTRVIDYEQKESMSKVLPFTLIVEKNGVSTLIKSDSFTSPYQGVPASAFSLSAVIESGGSLQPAPKIVGSNCETRDSIDVSFAEFELANQQRLKEKRFAEAYKNFKDALMA